MQLFNTKTLQKALGNTNFRPTSSQTEAATKWAAMIADGSLQKEKETAMYGEFRQLILMDILGYCGLSGDAPQTMKEHLSLGKGSVEFALGEFTTDGIKVVAPLELKGAKTPLDAIMPGRHKTPVQQAWEYAMDAPGASWVLVSNYLELRLYAVGHGRTLFESWQLADLANSEELAKLHLLLSAQNLLTGATKALLEQSEQEDQDITDALYADYKELRKDLISTICAQNETCNPRRAITFAQKILDRVLFTAFAEDTGLLPEDTLKRVYEAKNAFSTQTVWENFKTLFHFIDAGSPEQQIPAYNGGLFAKDDELDALIVPNDICHEFKKIGDYDFQSEITVHILGHLFEQSITDIEAMQAEALGQKPPAVSKKKQDGVVYTPPYVTAFIIEHTLGRGLEERFLKLLKSYGSGYGGTEQLPDAEEDIVWKGKDSEIRFWQAYREELLKIRVVDPACGSGAFLIAAFDFLESEYSRVNEHLNILSGGTGMGDLFDPHKDILTANLYGVDLNAESIEITKLSLWLRTARRGQPLESLRSNIKQGNSIIADKKVHPDAFDWKAGFPDLHKEGGFDIVIGNPPYVRMEYIKPYAPHLKKRYKTASGRADLYIYFYELGLKQLKPGGRLGFISSSSFFRTSAGQPLRLFMPGKAQLETVIDFGDLQIFPGVTTYPVVLTCKKTTNKIRKPSGDLEFVKLMDAVPENLSAYFKASKQTMSQKRLGAESWQFESEQLASLRGKIKGRHKSLKKVYGSPFYGIKTGRNEAFVVGQDIYNSLIEADPKSADLLKPFLEGKDLFKWSVASKNIWIIYIPKNCINISDYPAIEAHLLQYKEALENRATQQRWFELQQPQEANVKDYESKKIVYREFSDMPYFSADEKYFYHNNKCFSLPFDGYLLALLNSRALWLLVTKMADFKRGMYYELREQYIDTLPIPTASNVEKTTLGKLAGQAQKKAESRFELEAAVRQRIPDLCPATTPCKMTKRLQNWPSLDFAAFQTEIKNTFKTEIPLVQRNDWQNYLEGEAQKIQQLTREIALLEQDMNNRIYKLFKLTDEEIQLLEASLAGQV